MLAAGLVVFVGTVVIGPEALQLVFGSSYQAGREPLSLLAAGVGPYLAALVVSQGLFALGRPGHTSSGWAAALAGFAIGYLAWPGSPLDRIGFAFFCAATVSFVLCTCWLALLSSRRHLHLSEASKLATAVHR